MKKNYLVITKKFRDAQQQKSYFYAEVLTVEGTMDLKWLLAGPEIVNACIMPTKRQARALVRDMNEKWIIEGKLAGKKIMNKYYGIAV